MTQFLVLILSFFAGFMCKFVRSFPKETGKSLNLFVIYISLPALILIKIPRMIETLDIKGEWWIPITMIWFAFFLAVLFTFAIGKILNWPSKMIGALMLTVGLGNTSFVGFPLLNALYGPESIPIGILADQGGSFLLVSTLGIVIASLYSGESIHPVHLLKRLFFFPPFFAILIAILWYSLNLVGSEYFLPALNPIAATLVPLALFAVGFQTNINFDVLRRRCFGLTYGLSFKLLFIPLLCWLAYVKIGGLDTFFTKISVIESAMATQITSGVVATEYDLDPEIAQLMVTLSVPLSLLTIPLWHYFLG